MIYPTFQRVYRQDGRVVILKTERVSEADAERFQKAAIMFKKKQPRYGGFDDDRKRAIAGILLEFEADQFSRDDLIRWSVFADENFKAEEISSVLNQSQKDKNHPIRSITKGPNAQWKVEKKGLESFLL